MPAWGQLICGPPGSGKTTYSRAMHEFLNAAGRPTVLVNLDPANDVLPYTPDVNIFDLVSLSDVADAYTLGPNGGLIYCLEYLHKNLDWLEEKLAPFRDAGYYILFDCPGQAELYTHHEAFFKIVHRLQKLDYNLVAVHLVDAHHCSDPGKFIAAALLSLTAMIRLELPHVNVLSKVDMLPALRGSHGPDDASSLPFDLDFFTDVTEISHLAYLLRDTSNDSSRDNDEISNSEAVGAGEDGEGTGVGDSALAARAQPPASASGGSGRNAGRDRSPAPPAAAAAAAVAGARRRRARFRERYARLNDKLAEIIDDHSLVAFVPLSLQQPERILHLVKAVDRAGGYVPLKPPAGSAGERHVLEAGARLRAAADTGAARGAGGFQSSGPGRGQHSALAGSEAGLDALRATRTAFGRQGDG